MGSGKTLLFNKLTNSSKPVSSGPESSTSKITSASIDGTEFTVIDTPGFDDLKVTYPDFCHKLCT